MKTTPIRSVGAMVTFFLLAGALAAQVVDNSTVEIVDWYESFTGYDVENVLDTGDERFLSDYASQGGADLTFIEFDFGEPIVFSQITETDRVTSGGPNFAWFGGLFDFNTAFNYIFSVDDSFTNGDGVNDDIVIAVERDEPLESPVPEDMIDLLQTVTVVPRIKAQFLRWEVVETNGANPGANDFEFVADAGGLQPGDADMDFDFDQLDLVQVQIAAKYLTGQPATWGEGDWDGGPGGEPGNPPVGDGLFNQLDVISALNAGFYLTGPYNALQSSGTQGDDQTSIVYNTTTGEVAVDAPVGVELTSVNIDSAAGIFTGDAAQNLGGSFDNDADNNIFKATFGGSFGSISFGAVAQAGLSEQFVAGDLTVVGSLAGGGDLGEVDLIYVPEPSAMVLLCLGLLGWLARTRRWGSGWSGRSV